jgi:hypothetical protein
MKLADITGATQRLFCRNFKNHIACGDPNARFEVWRATGMELDQRTNTFVQTSIPAPLTLTRQQPKQSLPALLPGGWCDRPVISLSENSKTKMSVNPFPSS